VLQTARRARIINCVYADSQGNRQPAAGVIHDDSPKPASVRLRPLIAPLPLSDSVSSVGASRTPPDGGIRETVPGLRKPLRFAFLLVLGVGLQARSSRIRSCAATSGDGAAAAQKLRRSPLNRVTGEPGNVTLRPFASTTFPRRRNPISFKPSESAFL